MIFSKRSEGSQSTARASHASTRGLPDNKPPVEPTGLVPGKATLIFLGGMAPRAAELASRFSLSGTIIHISF